MRFSLSVFVAIVGVAVAAPTLPVTGGGVTDYPVTDYPVTGLLGSNDLVGELTGVVDQVEAGLSGGPSPQIVHAVAQGIALVEQGVAIQTVDAYVKGMTNGAVTSLNKALGIDNI
ncbi:hypothetical protein G3M48_010197 [Beauveria asiatica]|uniref:Uncharacterized protein n=1 Tax=Beauveria asiatica TaxID=1069075 RepID=A0AAW0RHH2_9HYPO